MTINKLILLSVIVVFGESLASLHVAPDTSKDTNKNDQHNVSKPKKHENETLSEDEIKDDGWEFENTTLIDSRRILFSKKVPIGKRPYMVYLQLTKASAKAHKYSGWLCGGVIVNANFVLTSAACVEDADRFYIVSGTTKFVDSFDYKSDECVRKHRRKVVWKYLPKNYKFDVQDSGKWLSNDIAIVKVEKPFKLRVRENSCEFATDLIYYNNISSELEKPGTKAFVAGWGSGSNFREGVHRRKKVHNPENSKYLQEAKVSVMDNEQCAEKWDKEFRSIITEYMICTKDLMKRHSEICDDKYANCTDIDSHQQIEGLTEEPATIHQEDLGEHLKDPDDYTARRSSTQGGICENDHGGPLIVKYKGKEHVTGIISACKIDPESQSCRGPFLYTSVFSNRHLVSCAINKDVVESCPNGFQAGITHEEWPINWDNVDEDDENQNKTDSEKEDKKSDSNRNDDIQVKHILRQLATTKEKPADNSHSLNDTEKNKSEE